MKTKETTTKNLLCFSHLRWDFVFQRPQHLLTRIAKYTNVYFIEEPVFGEGEQASLSLSKRGNTLTIATPYLKAGMPQDQVNQKLEGLVGQLLDKDSLDDWTFWYYTPAALDFSRKYKPALIVFDCMDELSAFKFAPASLKQLEKELLQKADVVFTGGYSLYEAKKNHHNNIWPVPSSIEKEHFIKARYTVNEPQDQALIKGPKIGFYGVLDERFDLVLIEGIASQRPDWQIVLIGPIVKIDPSTLPKNANIHYLGQKTYEDLPYYLSGWDVALIPFAINESTRFISPTKTPEYLAAGKPVVSTPIRDVVMPYGVKNLVSIATDADEFIEAIDTLLNSKEQQEWLKNVDSFLKNISWDLSHAFIAKQMSLALSSRSLISIAS